MLCPPLNSILPLHFPYFFIIHSFSYPFYNILPFHFSPQKGTRRIYFPVHKTPVIFFLGEGGLLTYVGEKLLHLLRLLVKRVLVAHESEELGLELGVQAGDHQFHGVPDLTHSLILKSPGTV
jgi:hypothetical protein